MGDLPAGTVTLVFTDIEGSTLLLGRLGAAYGDVLDEERRILREAWAAHGGSEVDGEADSFFVVFPTAQGAVSAAVQVQRSLSEYEWPGGENVRVRIGVHTGTPTLRGNRYVGMDVHRAARVAAAAHGGQVLLTATTAELIGDGLPASVHFHDLGSHRLKDMAAPVHLFQLDVDGLQADFPALRSLGASSRLPVPATTLVGRRREIADLTALLRSGVRLVTLTGAGGSGKTRLAIAVAHDTADAFVDGVHFVSLAADTDADVMWTSIAEVLDLPPDARSSDGVLAHVEHRQSLLVLDNLEQLVDADRVVAALLSGAPRLVVLATSRRPLHVTSEHERFVPGLDLPTETVTSAALMTSAMELFTQRAQMAKHDFALTDDNANHVAEVCRHLDGLPLAIELAASRAKLLSPRALLARMENVLDLAATSGQTETRQRTLRDTISWSYALLEPDEQLLFRQLGVFSGGATLDAIEAVGLPRIAVAKDPLDRLAALVDASLVTATESQDGEPRIEMLETIRTFAHDELATTGELAEASERHARVYLDVAVELGSWLAGPRDYEGRTRLEIELDNMRQALAWASRTESPGAAVPDRVLVGLRLCASLDTFWRVQGYYREARQWLEKILDRAGDRDQPELAHGLALLAYHLVDLGELDRAYARAVESVSMWRRLRDTGAGLCTALRALAYSESYRGHPEKARPAYEEALRAARASGDQMLLHRTLSMFGTFEAIEHHESRSIELDTEALAVARSIGDRGSELAYRHNIACTLRLLGRVQEAAEQMQGVITEALSLDARARLHPAQQDEPAALAVFAEDYAAVSAELGEPERAAFLLGAAEAVREQLGIPRPEWQSAEIAAPIAKSRAAVSAEEWAGAYREGLNTAIEDALSVVAAAESV